MPDKSPKKREPPISYRPPAALRQDFYARVEKSGLSTSAFITRAVFGDEAARGTRRPPIEQKMLAKLLASAATIQDQLHEVNLAGHAGQSVLLEQAVQELAEIRAALLKNMGRKP